MRDLHNAGGGHWLDNGARALSDGQGAGLGDSVGLATDNNGGCGWAVGGIGSDDCLSNISIRSCDWRRRPGSAQEKRDCDNQATLEYPPRPTPENRSPYH